MTATPTGLGGSLVLSVTGVAWGCAPMMTKPNSRVPSCLHAAQSSRCAMHQEALLLVEPLLLISSLQAISSAQVIPGDHLRGHQRILRASSSLKSLPMIGVAITHLKEASGRVSAIGRDWGGRAREERRARRCLRQADETSSSAHALGVVLAQAWMRAEDTFERRY